MSVDLFKHVHFNDGEGLTHGDLENIGQFNLARIMDQLTMPHFGDYDLDPFIAVNNADYSLDLDADNYVIARTVSPGCAVLQQGTGGTAGNIYIGPGTIIQKVPTTFDGSTPTVLPFTIKGAAQASLIGPFTPAAGHATNHRIDLIQVKLEQISDTSETRDFEDAVTGAKSTTSISKQRRVQATFSLKDGTSGGNATISSIVIPTPDAGYAVVGYVFIPANWVVANGFNTDGRIPASGATNAVLMQGTFPLGIRGYTVPAHQFGYSGATNWALNADGTATATGAGTNLRVWCPAAGGRIVGVGYGGTLVTSGSASAGFIRWKTPLTFENLGSIGATVGLEIWTQTSMRSITSPAGLPMWAQSGHSGPVERRKGTALVATPPRQFCLSIDAANTSKVAYVTFYVAGG